MCLGVGFFASILFGTLCFLDLHIYFLTISGKFSFIIFQIDFQLLALSLLFLPPLEAAYTILVFGILFSSCCSDWLFFASLCSKSLIWFLASSTLLLIPYKLFFISISVSFISDLLFFQAVTSSLSSLSILITSVLNSAPDRFLISIFFFLVLFPESWSVLSFGPCFFVSSFWQPPCVCFYV